MRSLLSSIIRDRRVVIGEEPAQHLFEPVARQGERQLTA
jgi:hypothetical protein